jgi:Xaa-Pro aminopeptidase
VSAETSRQDALLALLADRDLGALIVTEADNVRYRTGYVGSNGIALVGAGGRLLLTDSR